MSAKMTMYTLAVCLVVASAAAMATTRSWFEAYTSGARTVALRGTATYGRVEEGDSGAFVVNLGADAPDGAVLFTRADGLPLTQGSYQLGEDPTREVQALVVTGPTSHPTGAYRAQAGTLTIGSDRDGVLDGYFTLQALGFDAGQPSADRLELQVHGAFTATPGR
jgi:hypothetical protein